MSNSHLLPPVEKLPQILQYQIGTAFEKRELVGKAFAAAVKYIAATKGEDSGFGTLKRELKKRNFPKDGSQLTTPAAPAKYERSCRAIDQAYCAGEISLAQSYYAKRVIKARLGSRDLLSTWVSSRARWLEMEKLEADGGRGMQALRVEWLQALAAEFSTIDEQQSVEEKAQ